MKRVVIEDDTHDTLKKIARREGRTLTGQLRFMIEQYGCAKTSSSDLQPIAAPKDEEPSELQQMINRLEYFDEGSPEYEEAVARIAELQKSA